MAARTRRRLLALVRTPETPQEHYEQAVARHGLEALLEPYTDRDPAISLILLVTRRAA